jgi:hypothetical protein
VADLWSFAVGSWRNMPNWQLTQATGRKATFRLTANTEFTFTLDGTSADAAQVTEISTDVWIYHNGSPLFRGRVGPTGDDVNPNSHASTFSAADYKTLLGRRLLFDGDTLSYSSQDQGTVAWGLVSTTQGHTGGNLGIVRGTGQTTGVTVTRTYQAGNPILTYLDQLGTLGGGFDYAINPTSTPTLTFDIYSPERGTDRGLVLAYPGNIASLKRTFDPGIYANAVRMSGDSTLTAVRVEAADIATRVEGRWDAQVGDTTILEAATLTSRANDELSNTQTIMPSYEVVLQPNTWTGPEMVWLGDPVRLVIKSGRINENSVYRVQEIAFEWDDNGTAKTTLTLGALPPDRRYLLRTINRRLTAIERR